MLIITADMLQSLCITLEDGSEHYYIGPFTVFQEDTGRKLKEITFSGPRYIENVMLANSPWCGLIQDGKD